MIYRRFGKTGLSMPVFSCGGMRFQHTWGKVLPQEIPEKNQTNLEAIVHRALELGINHFETARAYGTSEFQLGRILPKLHRDDLIIQTKVVPKENPKEFEQLVRESFVNLELGYVDLLTIHGINNEDTLNWTLQKNGALQVARRLQKEGRCRFIGFSSHGTAETICKAANTGEFDYVNLHYYFVNPTLRKAVKVAGARDMGVFIISPNDKGGKLYERPRKMTELCAPLSPMQFNDLFCLSLPEVHTLSIGAFKPEDFDEHVQALEYLTKDQMVVGKIENRLFDELEREFGKEWCTEWFRGVPNYNNIPGKINVFEILRLWTYGKGLGLTSFAKARYGMLGNAGHWFPGANAAQFDADEIMKALGNYTFASKVPEILKEAHELFFDDD